MNKLEFYLALKHVGNCIEWKSTCDTLTHTQARTHRTCSMLVLIHELNVYCFPFVLSSDVVMISERIHDMPRIIIFIRNSVAIWDELQPVASKAHSHPDGSTVFGYFYGIDCSIHLWTDSPVNSVTLNGNTKLYTIFICIFAWCDE